MKDGTSTSTCISGSRAGSLKRSRGTSSCPAFSTAAADAQQAIRPPAYGKCVIARESSCSEDHWVQETCVLGPLREPVSIFAVFDGHGGDGASKHSVQRLIHHLQQHIAEQLDGLGAPGAATAPADAFIEQALHAAFHQTDRELTDTLAANCGTTATVAVVTRRKIFLAWAGDSRAVVLAGGRVVAHTEEHRAHREDEQERLAAAGGRVIFNSGLRVMGILATTRAIGDHDLRPYGVVATPDVLELPRAAEQEFLALGSDGLWDVLNNQEVYDYASRTLRKMQEKFPSGTTDKGLCCACQAAGCASQALARAAREQRNSRDDITVLLVNLKTPCTALAAAAASPAGPSECCPHSGDGMAAASGSAPASTATTPKSSDDPVWSSSSGEVTVVPAARQVGSAPPDMLDSLGGGGDGGRFAGTLSVGLALGGSGRACALLNSASLNSLGSTELPVAVG
ncbi:hypothetical protein OEZ86_011143 [Tetradesmus obliquus]|nr:hypothetical protein OEZ86_011143 [Tetradesmus obliquus]